VVFLAACWMSTLVFPIGYKSPSGACCS
jgi:hypothetical protein